MLPLLFAAASRTAASASTCQYSSAIKGGPFAACCRSVIRSSVRCSEAIFVCLSSIPLIIGHQMFFCPAGFLCRTSSRLLSSSLLFRIFPAVWHCCLLFWSVKKGSTGCLECQAAAAFFPCFFISALLPFHLDTTAFPACIFRFQAYAFLFFIH